jgi:hypothetical protein
MRLSPAHFNSQLQEMGQKMLWRRAQLCPCRDPHSGGANPECPICAGRGVAWGQNIPAHAGVVGAKAMRAFGDFARWEDGDVVISIPSNSPLWGAGENDRVIFTDGHEPFQIQMTRNQGVSVPFAAERIDRCFWLGPNGSAVIECSLPRVDPSTRALNWADQSTAPDPGAQFTLSGRKRPEYFLYKDIPVSRGHFMGLALPKRAVLKKFDLFGR